MANDEVSSESRIVEYLVQQIYLEMSRAIVDCSFIKVSNSDTKLTDASKDANIRFSAVAVSVVFAYGAIEAFCNTSIYQKYNEYELLSQVDKTKYWEREHCKPKFKPFFEDDEKFNEILNKASVQLKLSMLASLYNVSQLQQKKPELWGQLCEFVKTARDFIIHPKPDPVVFQEKMSKIMEKYTFGHSSSIAEAVMKYYYDEAGGEPPSWLKHNEIFKIFKKDNLK